MPIENDVVAERVYGLIKSRITSGETLPGEHLHVGDLADQLNASTTPVREALVRLTAERLTSFVPKRGFFTKVPSEIETRALYELNLTLLTYALKVAKRRPPLPKSEKHNAATVLQARDELKAAPLARLSGDIFLHLAAQSGNSEIIHIVQNVNDRLFYIRCLECELVDGTIDELSRLQRLHMVGEFGELTKAVATYHRRRRHLLPALIKECFSRAYGSLSTVYSEGGVHLRSAAR